MRCSSDSPGQRRKVPDGSAAAKAIDYSPKRWQALTRHIDDGDLPADNNWAENQMRPSAIGRPSGCLQDRYGLASAQRP